MKRRNSEAHRHSVGLQRRHSELKRGGSFLRSPKRLGTLGSAKKQGTLSQLPQLLEPVCEYSIDEVSNHEQRERLAEYSESSSDANPEDLQAPDEIAPFDRRTRQLQKRASGLSVVSRTKVLRGVPTRLQVLFARQLKRLDYPVDGTDIIANAGDSSPEHSRFMVLDDGFVDVVATCPSGKEVVITRMGPGSIIGGLQSLGLSKTHLFTIRRSYVKSRSRKFSHGLLDTSKPHLETDVEDKEDVEIATPLELITYYMTASDMAQLEDQFREELKALRSRVLSDLFHFVVPHLERFASAGFFRRYRSDFVKRVVKNMDMRICKPGELIFKENSKAQSMAILFCGWIDIYVDDHYISTQGEPGLCFGEAALLEDHALRTATVRSNDKSDCVVCLLQKEDFHAALNEFPQEKKRLDEQVKSKLTRLSMQAVFVDCKHDFLHFLSAIADSLELEEGQLLYDTNIDKEESDTEALVLIQRGAAVRQRVGKSDELLEKGAFVGRRGAIGLHRGPPDYMIRAQVRGCSLVRITYEMFNRAFVYYPDQVAPVLKDLGLDMLPEEHPFNHKDSEIWNIVQPLLCQAFMTMDFDVDICKALAPFFKVEICDPGCTITEEGKEGHEMVLLLDGTVSWHTAGKVSTVATGPRYFDEGLIIGTQRRQTATITANSMCVLWLLSNTNLQAMKKCHSRICGIFDDAATLRRSLLLNLQARLRNMKTFRRFRSEILELISRSVDIRTYLPGDVIFDIGDVADCLYILLQGKAEAVISGRSGPLEEGSTFGEMALFGQVKRNMTVKSGTLCICNVVHRDIITYAFTQFPEDQHLLGTHSEPRNRGALASTVAPRVKPTEEKTFSKPRQHKRSSNFTSAASGNSAGSAPNSAGSVKNGGSSTVGAREKRAMTLAVDHDSGARAMRRAKSFPAKAHESAEGGEGSDGGFTSSSDSSSSKDEKDEDDNGDASDEERTDSFQLQTGEKMKSLASVASSQAAENAFNLVRDESEPPSIVEASDQEDVFTSTMQGPHELQHRSCLFNMIAPKLPPADYQLYRSPKGAEEKLSAAFRNLMPRDAAAISARVHGLPSAARSRQQFDTLAEEMSRETFLSASGKHLHRRVWPTYTSPLPPVHPLVRPLTNPSAFIGAYAKDTERTVAIAAQLQLLSSSLLRISSKPTLRHLGQESQQEARQAGDEDMNDDMSAVSSKPSSAKGSRKTNRSKPRNEGARSIYEPQAPKRPREKQRPQRNGAFAYQAPMATLPSSVEPAAQAKMTSTSAVKFSNSIIEADADLPPKSPAENGVMPLDPSKTDRTCEQDTYSGNPPRPKSADQESEQLDSLADSKELSSLTDSKELSLSGPLPAIKRGTELVLLGCEGPDATTRRNILTPTAQNSRQSRFTLGPTNALLKELLVRRVQTVADRDTAAELEKFGEEGNFDRAYELLREQEQSTHLMKRASVRAYFREDPLEKPLGRPSVVRGANFAIRRYILKQCYRRAKLAIDRKDALDAAHICRRACYAAIPQYQMSREEDTGTRAPERSSIDAVDTDLVQIFATTDPMPRPWKTEDDRDVAECVAAALSCVAVTTCTASINVSVMPEEVPSRENVSTGLEPILSWPSFSDEVVVPMKIAAFGDRPTTRKKAPLQEGVEPLLPMLELAPPPPKTSRNSLKGRRRVRVSNPEEERAASIALAYYVCRTSFEGAARLHLAKVERADVRMATQFARRSLMVFSANRQDAEQSLAGNIVRAPTGTHLDSEAALESEFMPDSHMEALKDKAWAALENALFPDSSCDEI